MIKICSEGTAPPEVFQFVRVNAQAWDADPVLEQRLVHRFSRVERPGLGVRQSIEHLSKLMVLLHLGALGRLVVWQVPT